MAEFANFCSNEEGKEDNEESFADIFPFQDQDVDLTREKRESCARCMRPQIVCLCGYFPKTPMQIHSTVHILQHPREPLYSPLGDTAKLEYSISLPTKCSIELLVDESRLLTTVPLLQACLQQNRIRIYQGVKFRQPKFAVLHEYLQKDTAVLLYPGEKAMDIDVFLSSHNKVKNFGRRAFDLILLDGTWREARRLYFHNPVLHSLPQIKLKEKKFSEFIIRTQPTNDSVSTLEATAFALAVLEDKPELSEILISPLKALCQIQLDHGAVIHQSKEEKAKISSSQ